MNHANEYCTLPSFAGLTLSSTSIIPEVSLISAGPPMPLIKRNETLK